MEKLFNNMNNILFILIGICLVLLAWSSVFIWHNGYCALAFTICILIWLWGWEGKDE